MSKPRIVIVGGATGIGYAIAERALKEGARVVLASRSLDNLRAAASQLGSSRVTIEQVDASDDQSVVTFFERLGHFDHMAITIKPHLPSARFLDNDIAATRAAFDAKFWGQYRLVKHGVKHVNEGGSIVLTSGIAAQRSYPGYSIVSAMNAATEALCKSLATELAPIRVNCVSPGFVDATSPIIGRYAYVKALVPHLPLDRLGVAQEIADAYFFLFGNAYATGTVLLVDGGALA